MGDPGGGQPAGPTTPARFLVLSLRPALIYVVSRVGTLLVAGSVAGVVHRSLGWTLNAWDSHWYLSIASSGYVHSVPAGYGDPDQTNLGFFPLLPLLIRGTHAITGLHWTASGLVTTFGLGLLASVAVWWLLRDVFGTSGADRGTALVFFSPGAFVLSLVYSEGATVLLVACALLALRRRRWVVAGLAAAAASAADPVAVAVIAPCAVASFLAIRRRGEWRSLVAPLLAPTGVVAFFAYLWAHTGTPLQWFHAQRHGWQSGTYGYGVPRALSQVFHNGFASVNWTVKSSSAIVALGLLVVFFRAHPPAPWIAYVLAVLALGVISPVIGITPRLLLRCFPLLGVVGARLPRLWFEVVLGLSALCLAALAVVSLGGPAFTP